MHVCVCVWVYIYMLCALLSCLVVSNSFVTPWTITQQASLSMGFPKQEYWSGLPFPTPRESSRPRNRARIFLHLLHWQMDSLPLHHLGSTIYINSGVTFENSDIDSPINLNKKQHWLLYILEKRLYINKTYICIFQVHLYIYMYFFPSS